jgi:hypothetical protein
MKAKSWAAGFEFTGIGLTVPREFETELKIKTRVSRSGERTVKSAGLI